jgi:hypothetical protein
MSQMGHSRRFRTQPGRSVLPPKAAVRADMRERQLRAITGREHMQQNDVY